MAYRAVVICGDRVARSLEPEGIASEGDHTVALDHLLIERGLKAVLAAEGRL